MVPKIPVIRTSVQPRANILAAVPVLGVSNWDTSDERYQTRENILHREIEADV